MDKTVIIAIIIGIVVLGGGLYFGGVFNTEDNSILNGDTIDDASVNDIPANEPFDGILMIRIEYDGMFTAGYGSANKNDDFTATGSQEIDLGNSSYVDVGAKKSDDSSRLLKLTILKDGVVVAEKTTSDPYGEVIIHYTIN